MRSVLSSHVCAPDFCQQEEEKVVVEVEGVEEEGVLSLAAFFRQAEQPICWVKFVFELCNLS